MVTRVKYREQDCQSYQLINYVHVACTLVKHAHEPCVHKLKQVLAVFASLQLQT